MREFAIAALTLCLSAASATAGEDADAPPTITYHVPGVTIVLQHDKQITLKPNGKTTWLKKAFTYDCLAANCLVVATSEAVTHGEAGDLCVYVDGKRMKSTCAILASFSPMHNFQGQLVSQGTHSFQAGVGSDVTMKSTVCPCIIAYTIYDSSN